MSKAALVLDEMPGVCADCPFDNDGKCYITGEDLYWNDGDNDDNSNIGNDCPLKPMPEPRSVAHWVEERGRIPHWHCSECGYLTGLAGLMYKYCPECGAELEERHYEID